MLSVGGSSNVVPLCSVPVSVVGSSVGAVSVVVVGAVSVVVVRDVGSSVRAGEAVLVPLAAACKADCEVLALFASLRSKLNGAFCCCCIGSCAFAN